MTTDIVATEVGNSGYPSTSLSYLPIVSKIVITNENIISALGRLRQGEYKLEKRAGV